LTFTQKAFTINWFTITHNIQTEGATMKYQIRVNIKHFHTTMYKKFINSKNITMLTFFAGALTIEGMGHQLINPLAPLQELVEVSESIQPSDFLSSAKRAYQDAFSLMCARVVYSPNPNEAKSWLQNSDITQGIDRLDAKFKKHINDTYVMHQHEVRFLLCMPPKNQKDYVEGAEMNFMQTFRAFDDARKELLQKRNTLIRMIDEGTVPAFLDDYKSLEHAVERKILWKNVANDTVTVAAIAAAGCAVLLLQ
jgi:hypothetical protein